MSNLHLSMKDNGTTIRTTAGTTLVIALEGNPTTGFEWVTDEVNNNLIAGIQSKYERTNSTAMGAGGAFVFTVKTSGKGTGRLSLKYWRRWQGDASVSKRFEIQLSVV